MILRRYSVSIVFVLSMIFVLSAVFFVARPVAASAPVLTIKYPYDKTVFPIDFAAPTFQWHTLGDKESASKWRLEFDFSDNKPPIRILCDKEQWQPEANVWLAIKERSLENPSELTITSLLSSRGKVKNNSAAIQFTTSADPVSAPIFFRDVLLPFRSALMRINEIEWKLGDVSSEKPAPTVLTDFRTCANCHSFPADGSVLAMDVDYGNDKGSYIISPIDKEVHLKQEEIISWSDFHREDGAKTFGLLSRISPDGRYVISTVRDRSVQLPANGIAYSQLFFPIQGILAVYDRQTRDLYPLSGADDPAFVQSNPAWSPDGKWIVFARAKADTYENIKEKYINNKKKIRYDLVRIPFNGGRGGTAKLLEGASLNLKSNYFAKYSPDGRWIVFCQADSYMLLQEDSQLYRIPSSGGQARRLLSNHPGTMNSWHSFSPNGKWLVFASKVNGPYTQLWLTHFNPTGIDSPPVLLENFVSEKHAANIPEFVNIEKGKMLRISVSKIK